MGCHASSWKFSSPLLSSNHTTSRWCGEDSNGKSHICQWYDDEVSENVKRESFSNNFELLEFYIDSTWFYLILFYSILFYFILFYSVECYLLVSIKYHLDFTYYQKYTPSLSCHLRHFIHSFIHSFSIIITNVTKSWIDCIKTHTENVWRYE